MVIGLNPKLFHGLSPVLNTMYYIVSYTGKGPWDLF